MGEPLSAHFEEHAQSAASAAQGSQSDAGSRHAGRARNAVLDLRRGGGTLDRAALRGSVPVSAAPTPTVRRRLICPRGWVAIFRPEAGSSGTRKSSRAIRRSCCSRTTKTPARRLGHAPPCTLVFLPDAERAGTAVANERVVILQSPMAVLQLRSAPSTSPGRAGKLVGGRFEGELQHPRPSQPRWRPRGAARADARRISAQRPHHYLAAGRVSPGQELWPRP